MDQRSVGSDQLVELRAKPWNKLNTQALQAVLFDLDSIIDCVIVAILGYCKNEPFDVLSLPMPLELAGKVADPCRDRCTVYRFPVVTFRREYGFGIARMREALHIDAELLISAKTLELMTFVIRECGFTKPPAQFLEIGLADFVKWQLRTCCPRWQRLAG